MTNDKKYGRLLSLTLDSKLELNWLELDSKSMTMHVPKTNVDKIKFESHQLVSKKTATIHHRARCIGLIIHIFEAFPQDKLHYWIRSSQSRAISNQIRQLRPRLWSIHPLLLKFSGGYLFPVMRSNVISNYHPLIMVILTEAILWLGAICEKDNCYHRVKWPETPKGIQTFWS